MNRNKLTFKDENITVDWIGFKFQNLDNFAQTKLAEYLFKIGFNSYQESGKLAKPIKESILVSSKNKFQVLFVHEAPYWKGTSVYFSGASATFFYSFVKQTSINWEFFSSAILGRFDLNYVRKNKTDDKISVRQFLENCQTKLMQTNKNISLEKNSKGLILKIGTRRSNNYSRIYQGKNFLKFEHEMKGKFIKTYHTLLIQNHFEEFEHKLSIHFLTYFGKVLPLQYSYTDWLVIKLRPLRKQTFSLTGLKIDYLRSGSFQNNTDSYKFCTLLQFLVYAQTLNYKIDSLGTTSYRLVQFRVQDFLKYTKLSSNYYQLKKLIEFFDELQTNSLIKFFSNQKYRSLVTIPEVNFQKGKQNSWTVEVWIADELFYYAHPFLLPDLFQVKLTKLQLEVQVHVIRTFSSFDTQKIFYVEEFLQAYPSTLNNQQITSVKRYFIQLMEIFEEHQLIEPSYQVILDDKLYHVDKLLTNNISQGFIVFEKLLI
jgi:hypothetical protein